jgi:hypothetical protein
VVAGDEIKHGENEEADAAGDQKGIEHGISPERA